MIKIAIAEDEKKEAEKLESYIRRYGAEHGENYNVSVFTNGIDFVSSAEPFHIVFLDIDMPLMGGLDAAKKLREADKSACIIFVTNLAQYAVKGYEVDAMDFVVKPIDCPSFESKFKKALYISQSAHTYSIILPLKAGFRKLAVEDIVYVEVQGHILTFHLKDEIVSQRMPLSRAKEMLGEDFVQCNKCYLVNLAYVTGVTADTVTVGSNKLELSRLKKRELLDSLAAFLGKRG